MAVGELHFCEADFEGAVAARLQKAAHEGLPEQRLGAWRLVFFRGHGDGVAAHRVAERWAREVGAGIAAAACQSRLLASSGRRHLQHSNRHEWRSRSWMKRYGSLIP